MNLKRIGLWGGAVILLGLMVWGLAKLAAGPNATVSDVDLSEPVGNTDHVYGNPMGRVSFVEYSDFECPACAAFFPVLKALEAKYDKQVLFVFRHFPLPQHAYSTIAAKAAEAAGNQGKFWEMHDILFQSQSTWANSKAPEQLFFEYAKNIGLNMNQFKTDYNATSTIDHIQKEIESGNRSGVDGTPSFYLNGKKITNLQTYGDLDRLIDQALSQK